MTDRAPGDRRAHGCYPDGGGSQVTRLRLAQSSPERMAEYSSRFWSSVLIRGQDECWPWKKNKNRAGYGKTRFFGKHRGAHRVAFLLSNGHWPTPCCCHSCDNPACCNPMHLWEGTIADNNSDMVKKGRQTNGDKQSEIMKRVACRGRRMSDVMKRVACRGARMSEIMKRVAARGEHAPGAKLSELDVVKMISLKRSGMSYNKIASQFGVCKNTVVNAVRGFNWVHVHERLRRELDEKEKGRC